MFKYNFNFKEKKIIKEFNDKGYIVFNIKNLNRLNRVKKEVENVVFKKLFQKKIKIYNKDKKNEPWCWRFNT